MSVPVSVWPVALITLLLSFDGQFGTATAAPASKHSLSTNPPSYFTGPLGRRNILPPRSGAFLFLFPSGHGDSIDAQRARVLERERFLGRKFDGVHVHYGGGGTYRGVSHCIAPDRVASRPELWIHNHGAIALTSWSPDRSLADINAGLVDRCFRNAADHFKRYRFTMMLRLFWEFDGDWFKWAASPGIANGNVNGCGRPLISAWRRVVRIFKERGANNVGFWWNPTEGTNRPCIDNSYPGDRYVDWVGTEIYNFCGVDDPGCYSTPLRSGWARFHELIDYASGPSYQTQSSKWGPRKPIVVGESGTVYDPDAPATLKGDWYREIPATARKLKYLRGISFYDADVSAVEDSRRNFKVDHPLSNPDVYEGFKQMALDPWFNTRSRKRLVLPEGAGLKNR